MQMFRLQNNLLLLTPCVLPVLGIFYVVGFSFSGMMEEWDLLHYFDYYGRAFVLNSEHPLYGDQMIRPLTLSIFSLAHYLDPNSFIVWNLFLAIAIIFKGFFAAKIIDFIFKNKFLSIAAGLLIILYPADTMQFSFRSLNINLAATLLLFSSWLWLASSKQNRKLFQLALYLLAASIFAIACLTYENALFLWMLPFLIIYTKCGIKEGFQHLKSNAAGTMLWLLATVLLVSRMIYTLGESSGGYQLGAMNLSAGMFEKYYSYLVTIGMFRALIHGWFDAALMFFKNFNIILTIFFLALCFLSYKYVKQETLCIQNKKPIASSLRLLLSGLVLTAFGYLPFIISYYHVVLTQRTYLFASIGAGFVCIALISLFMQTKVRLLAPIMALGMLSLGYSAQLLQAKHYASLAEQQRNIFAEILTVAPAVNDGTQIILFDHAGYLTSKWMLQNQRLQHGLSYFYKTPVTVYVCSGPTLTFPRLIFPQLAPENYDYVANSMCIMQDEKWGTSSEAGFSPFPNQEKHIFIDLHPDITASLRDDSGNNLAALTDEKLSRLISFFGSWPYTRENDNKITDTDSFSFAFGDWWSLEVPATGTGWRQVEWRPNGFTPYSFSWKIQEHSNLHFNLKPSNEQYVLRVKIIGWTFEDAVDELEIYINDTPVIYTWPDIHLLEAQFDSSILNDGDNNLIFSSPVDSIMGVSIALEEVVIEPIK